MQESVKIFKYFKEYNVEKHSVFIFSNYLPIDSDALCAYKYIIEQFCSEYLFSVQEQVVLIFK